VNGLENTESTSPRSTIRLRRITQYPVGDHADVVGDEQDRGIQLLPQIPEQLKDLGLHGDVQGGGRFVRDQHGRIVGQGQRDHRALFLTAGQLMREGVDPGGRLRNAHQVEQFDGPPPRLGSADPLVGAERGDLPAGGAAGVERSSAVCPSRSVGAIAHRRTWSVPMT